MIFGDKVLIYRCNTGKNTHGSIDEINSRKTFPVWWIILAASWLLLTGILIGYLLGFHT